MSGCDASAVWIHPHAAGEFSTRLHSKVSFLSVTARCHLSHANGGVARALMLATGGRHMMLARTACRGWRATARARAGACVVAGFVACIAPQTSPECLRRAIPAAPGGSCDHGCRDRTHGHRTVDPTRRGREGRTVPDRSRTKPHHQRHAGVTGRIRVRRVHTTHTRDHSRWADGDGGGAGESVEAITPVCQVLMLVFLISFVFSKGPQRC